jgi:hypothetical protein
MLFKPGSKHPFSLPQVAFTKGQAIQGIYSILYYIYPHFPVVCRLKDFYGVGSSIRYTDIHVFEYFCYKFCFPPCISVAGSSPDGVIEIFH